jgi:hypothetical protein
MKVRDIKRKHNRRRKTNWRFYFNWRNYKGPLYPCEVGRIDGFIVTQSDGRRFEVVMDSVKEAL